MNDTMTDSSAGLRAATLELVARGHRYSAFYGGALSNHLPMALVALDRLGAGDEEIASFAAQYERRLRPLPPRAGTITEETAEAFLGRGEEALTSWIEFFEGRIAASGAEETTRRWLDRLMPGIGSVAFHGLLRLAYAREIGSDRETAHALAQWAAGYRALGALPAFPAFGASPARALALLNESPLAARGRYPGSNIAERMTKVAEEAGFPALVGAVGDDQLSTRTLAREMLGAYAATGNFTVLHGVTACHAFRVLTPLISDPVRGRRYLWQALTCAYLSAGGSASGSPLREREDLSWERIGRLAALSPDEHDAKLAYACLREQQAYGGDLYRRVAGAVLSRRER